MTIGEEVLEILRESDGSRQEMDILAIARAIERLRLSKSMWKKAIKKDSFLSGFFFRPRRESLQRALTELEYDELLDSQCFEVRRQTIILYSIPQ